jgi:hypothetical protein
MTDLRFCASQYEHLPLDALRGRWRDAERCGFDVLWNCDTVVELDQPRHTLFDGPATLTMMAAETHRIRVGMLVTSLYLRQPVTVTKAAVTVDHLSGGRVELALGVSDPSAGAKASGVDLSAGERVARFGDFVELVDLLLRQEVTTYHGQFYRCEEAETVPLRVQQPRPPVAIAAHGPKILRIAASMLMSGARAAPVGEGAAGPAPPGCWSPPVTTPPGSAAKPASPRCAAPARPTPPRADNAATAPTAAGTGRPTPHSGGSCSPGWPPTRASRPTSPGAPQRARPPEKSSAASGGTSPARSTRR